MLYIDQLTVGSIVVGAAPSPTPTPGPTPSTRATTIITTTEDGAQEFDIENLDMDWWASNGFFSYDDGWLKTITAIDTGTNLKHFYAFACANMSTLTEISMTEGLITIGEFCFQNATGLTTLIIPSTVNDIGYAPFEGCSNLTSITFIGKTMAELENIEGSSDGGTYYPWGISNTSIIHVA